MQWQPLMDGLSLVLKHCLFLAITDLFLSSLYSVNISLAIKDFKCNIHHQNFVLKWFSCTLIYRIYFVFENPVRKMNRQASGSSDYFICEQLFLIQNLALSYLRHRSFLSQHSSFLSKKQLLHILCTRYNRALSRC